MRDEKNDAMSEQAESSPNSPEASTNDEDASDSGKGKKVAIWAGAVIIVLLLILPTLGSFGANSRYYQGEQFICPPAVGPTTSYPVNMFEPVEDDRSDKNFDAINLIGRKANMTSSEVKNTFEVAVCGEQRSRRVAWALVLTVPTLLIGLSGRWEPKTKRTAQ